MANVLPREKLIAVIAALAEGSSIRSIERMAFTGTRSCGADVEYAQIINTYAHDGSQHPERKYSAPRLESIEKNHMTGNPDMNLVSNQRR